MILPYAVIIMVVIFTRNQHEAFLGHILSFVSFKNMMANLTKEKYSQRVFVLNFFYLFASIFE